MKKYHHVLLAVNLTDKVLKGVKVGDFKYDLKPRTGVFRYRTNKSEAWTQMVTGLSWEAVKRMLSRQKYDKLPINIPYVGTEFVSKYNSPEYKDSPFRLVKFKPSKDSDIPENYCLEVVDEVGESIFDDTLGETVGYKNRRRSVWNYYRYEKRTVVKSFADLEDGTVIAMPDLKIIEL